MFDSLSDRLANTMRNLSRKGRLTDKNIKDSLSEVRKALIDADVAFSVVKPFIERIRKEAMGAAVTKSLTPGQELIRIVHNELVMLLGESQAEINLNMQPPAVILMAGFQGSGKTTSVAKLAHWLKTKQKKSVMVVSADIYRPAAIEQLEHLAKEVDVAFHPSDPSQKPNDIAKAAIASAKKHVIDVVIVDTAGRLHIDDDMMNEIKSLHQTINPIETLFVVDSMTGQDAANTAKAFHDALPLTGVILTKADGDSRGGAALSIREITGKPIKFMGIGEKFDALEAFHPDRLASRILGMGDIMSLIEDAEQKIDVEQATKLAKKISKGKGFDFEDFKLQIQQMRNIGGISGLMDKMPGMGSLPKGAKESMNDQMFVRFEAIINSMTKKERQFPQIIKGSRKRRIAKGSGNEVQEVNRLLKQFAQMQKMMKRMSKGGNMMRMMQGMKGNMPPGGPAGGDLL